MAFIEVVIEITEELYKALLNGYEEPYSQMFSDVVKNGTPLPKGHGRLIEANSVDKIVKKIEPSDAEWGMTAETAIRLIHDAFEKAPTIIEADKGEE